MTRLQGLLGVLAVLLALRWLAPVGPAGEMAVPVARSTAVAARGGGSEVAAPGVVKQSLESADLEPLGDAFVVRKAAAPQFQPPQHGQPSPVLPAVFHGPPPPPPPQPPPLPVPPPYRVIGVMHEETAQAVFLAGPAGTIMARTGDTLAGEFKVMSTGSGEMVLLHVPSGVNHRLVLPRTATR